MVTDSVRQRPRASRSFRRVRVAVGILLAVAFFGALAWATLRETAVSCEVCVSFAGRSTCRISSGRAEEEARQMAQSTACAELSSGVTQGMACQRATPTSVACSE
jgi:hypothetical protein